MDIPREWHITTLAIAIGAVGILAIIGGHFIPIKWLESIVAELGVALVIAAVLAVLVDGTLKLGLSRDVFETTFGYLLPKELQGELQWIYDQKLLCEHHSSHFILTKIDEHSILLRETFDRTFKNISNGSFEFVPSLAIDEWNHPTRKSRIALFGYELNGDTIEQKDDGVVTERLELGVLAVVPKHQKITLSKGQKIRVWGVIEEVPALNDHHISVFKYPTCNPHVRVTADDCLEARVTFGHREKVHAKHPGPGVWQLDGMLLPSQPMRVEWRVKSSLSS